MAFTDVIFTGNPPPGYSLPGSGATLTFTVVTAGSGATATIAVTSGAISGVTATPVSQGSGYPVSSLIYFSVAGGTGGVISGTTNSSGTLTFNTTALTTGSGYSAGTAITSIDYIAPFTYTSSGTGATVTFVATNGVITSVTAAPANQGSGYPASSIIYFLVAGGNGGIIYGTTNASSVLTFNTAPIATGTGYTSGTAATSTITTSTPLTGLGSIANITGIGAAGSSYLPSSTLYLLLGGGTGGVASVGTNGSGQVSTYTATPIAAGSGYTSGTAATSIVSIAPGGGTFLTSNNICAEMSRGNASLRDINLTSAICIEMYRGNIGTLTEITGGQPILELVNFTPNATDVRMGLNYGRNYGQTGTLIVGGTASGSLTLTKATGSVCYGGSGTCALLTPTSTSNYGYWWFYVPVTNSTAFTLSFYNSISAGWNGVLNATIFDTNQTTSLFSSVVPTVDDGNYHQFTCTQVTPTGTGLCLVGIGAQNGTSSGFFYIDQVAVT